MNFKNLFSVDGKIVCVTGGGGGIGRGIAGAFVAGGARVYIASRSSLSVTAEELDAEGPGECIALRADLSKDEDITALAAELSQRQRAGASASTEQFGEVQPGSQAQRRSVAQSPSRLQSALVAQPAASAGHEAASSASIMGCAVGTGMAGEGAQIFTRFGFEVEIRLLHCTAD